MQEEKKRRRDKPDSHLLTQWLPRRKKDTIPTGGPLHEDEDRLPSQVNQEQEGEEEEKKQEPGVSKESGAGGSLRQFIRKHIDEPLLSSRASFGHVFREMQVETPSAVLGSMVLGWFLLYLAASTTYPANSALQVFSSWTGYLYPALAACKALHEQSQGISSESSSTLRRNTDQWLIYFIVVTGWILIENTFIVVNGCLSAWYYLTKIGILCAFYLPTWTILATLFDHFVMPCFLRVCYRNLEPVEEGSEETVSRSVSPSPPHVPATTRYLQWQHAPMTMMAMMMPKDHEVEDEIHHPKAGSSSFPFRVVHPALEKSQEPGSASVVLTEEKQKRRRSRHPSRGKDTPVSDALESEEKELMAERPSREEGGQRPTSLTTLTKKEHHIQDG